MLGHLFYIWQFTWGLPQNIVGLIVYLIYRRCGHYRIGYGIGTYWPFANGVSLGVFNFVPEGAGEFMTAHEYGHTLQSVMLGPLYFLVIGIPSFIWCNLPQVSKKWKNGFASYWDFFPEKWANALAARQKREINNG